MWRLISVWFDLNLIWRSGKLWALFDRWLIYRFSVVYTYLRNHFVFQLTLFRLQSHAHRYNLTFFILLWQNVPLNVGQYSMISQKFVFPTESQTTNQKKKRSLGVFVVIKFDFFSLSFTKYILCYQRQNKIPNVSIWRENQEQT